MSTAVAGGIGADVTSLLSGVTTGLVAAAADPTIASFVLLLIALLIAVGRVRAVARAPHPTPPRSTSRCSSSRWRWPRLVWPAVSHWCRRLVETLAALILSKFVIVATLSLAAGAVSSGTAGTGADGVGFRPSWPAARSSCMATFVPFAILRLIPWSRPVPSGISKGSRNAARAP